MEALLARREEFDEANCRILFVSYSDPARPLQRLWIETWCQNYIEGIASAQMVLDPTKSVYEQWAVPSSNIAAWGPANTWYYIKAICCRRRRSVEIQGEAGQLGADVVLAPSTGKVLLAHYCKNPTDRVSVSNILKTVKGVQKDK